MFLFLLNSTKWSVVVDWNCLHRLWNLNILFLVGESAWSSSDFQSALCFTLVVEDMITPFPALDTCFQFLSEFSVVLVFHHSNKKVIWQYFIKQKQQIKLLIIIIVCYKGKHIFTKIPFQISIVDIDCRKTFLSC